ncbi:MAG: ABC transporter ATP-binding protein [Gemmatimonadota bacterium]|nr:ABC transporter ATP-binding protein [Gemmatimonadota bacterium]MDE2830636.1 ABC transporter ATP-binding protein [Gemmatimonadota bacterium]MDE2954673.1 ABC transporter ATP-binding protein [Gemmatimonadota bacterium]
MQAAIYVENVSHKFGERIALDDITLQVMPGEMYGLLGPNGSGKTTLFRMLCTMLPPDQGRICLLDKNASAVRAHIGVVFQHPSLDARLTVLENLRHQGHLYGLKGRPLSQRIEEVLDMMALTDRAKDRVEVLSGGLQRRVELCKSLLHHPEVLIFDEPGTGLDPGARRRFWDDLDILRRTYGTTLVLTTHFMEEAERCDRIGILDRGRLIAEGSPEELKRTVGREVITLDTRDPKGLQLQIEKIVRRDIQIIDGQVRIACDEGQQLLAQLYPLLQEKVQALTLSVPTLEDVFVQRTGHGFQVEDL